MSGAVKGGAFLVVLALVVAAAFAVGRYAAPDDAPAGDDYDLELADRSFEPGTRTVAFTVTRAGEPVTDFDVVHEKRLHLIAVREDLEGYQHVHPRLAEDGTWTVDLDLQPGTWRLYADFRARGGDATTLARPVTVAGLPASAVFRPDESRTDTVDGYRVTLEGDLAAGGDSTLSPRVTRDGKDVTDELQPYLGARGHLVALRHGDLAYLHVHPEGLDFHTEVPSADTYELFLDFKHDDVVRTARFRLPTADDEPMTEDHHDH